MLALVNGVFVSTKKKKNIPNTPSIGGKHVEEKPSKKWPARAVLPPKLAVA